MGKVPTILVYIYVYNYTINTFTVCTSITEITITRLLCMHNTFMVLVIIKFLVLYSQRDLTLYVDKNGTVEDLLQEAANEVYVISTLKRLDSSVG